MGLVLIEKEYWEISGGNILNLDLDMDFMKIHASPLNFILMHINHTLCWIIYIKWDNKIKKEEENQICYYVHGMLAREQETVQDIA